MWYAIFIEPNGEFGQRLILAQSALSSHRYPIFQLHTLTVDLVEP